MNSSQVSSATRHFDADRAIECREQDSLGRRSFAEEIARQIYAVPADHGFTIAVVGEWGSGKTSVLNMAAETLEDEVDTTAVLRFNPWLFGGATDLVTRFFRELGSQLGQGQFQRLRDVARAFSKLGQSLAPLSPVPGTTGAMNLAAQQIDELTKLPSLHEKRDQLRDALKKSGSRVVVLIDDIDRLEPGETRELVRLVRLTSDLPNVVFLLAFDRRHVAKSLGETEAEGQKYLDKIVQVSYNLPTIRKEILPGMLMTWLNELVQSRDITQLDKDVWGRVFYEVIKPLLSNLRDVKRYLNSLPVTLDTIGREVALADLLGLEALRVLRPSMFRELKSHADCLVYSESGSRSWMTKEEQKKEIGKELSAMLEREKGEHGVFKSVLEILFPATQGFLGLPPQGFLGSSSYGPERNKTWRKQRRVACEEVLRIYLQAGLDEGALQSREVQDLVDALTDEKELTRLLDGLDNQRFEGAIEWLEDFEQDFPLEAVHIAVPILVNRMGRLSGYSGGNFNLPPRVKVSRVVLRLLRRIENQEELLARMPAMLEKVDTLSGWLELVEMVGHRESVGHRLVGKDQTRQLEGQLVERLKSATEKQLTDEWDLTFLLFRPLLWLEGEDKVRLTTRLRVHLDGDGFVLNLLRTAVYYARYNGHVEKRLSWDALVETFGERLKDAADRLARSQLYRGLGEDDQDTINLAQSYASGWRPKGWQER